MNTRPTRLLGDDRCPGRLTSDVYANGSVVPSGTSLLVTGELHSKHTGADFYRVQIDGTDQGWWEAAAIELLTPDTSNPAAPDAPRALGSTGRLKRAVEDVFWLYEKGTTFKIVGEVITSRDGSLPYYRIEMPDSGREWFLAQDVEVLCDGQPVAPVAPVARVIYVKTTMAVERVQRVVARSEAEAEEITRARQQSIPGWTAVGDRDVRAVPEADQETRAQWMERYLSDNEDEQ